MKEKPTKSEIAQLLTRGWVVLTGEKWDDYPNKNELIKAFAKIMEERHWIPDEIKRVSITNPQKVKNRTMKAFAEFIADDLGIPLG